MMTSKEGSSSTQDDEDSSHAGKSRAIKSQGESKSDRDEGDVHIPVPIEIKDVSDSPEGDKESGSDDGGKRFKSFRVQRPIYTQQSFQALYKESPHEYVPYSQRLKRKLSRCTCSRHCCTSCIKRTFPITKWLPKYRIRKQLLGDVISGVTVCVMNIPQGMAYALLASVPAVYGLYLSFFTPIVYALTGTSRELAMGTFAVIAMMVSSAIEKVVPHQGPGVGPVPAGVANQTSVNTTDATDTWNREEELILAAVSLAFLAGLFQMLMGFLRLGWITIYLSDPFIRGYTTGAALLVFSSQLDDLLGLDIPRYSGPFKLIYVYRDIVMNITHTNYITVLLSVSCVVLLIVIKEVERRFKKQLRGYPLGSEMMVVILATLASHLIGLDDYGVEVIGDIPTGVPTPTIPSTTYMGSLITDALAIGIVAFAVSVSLASLFGQKNSYRVDANQELVAYGCTNTFCSFFSCFPSGCSLSRSLVQESSGGTSQIAGLVNSGLILVVLLVLAPLFESLPKAALAAIIVVSLKGMFRQFTDLPKLWKYDVIDFNLWWVTCLGVFLFDVDIGLMIGVGFSIFVVVWRTQEPYCSLLGRIPGTDIYRDVQYYTTAKEVPGIKIFRMMSSLYYANTNHFKKWMYKLTKINPRKVLQARARFELLREAADKKRKKEMKVPDDADRRPEETPEQEIPTSPPLKRNSSVKLCTPVSLIVSDDWTHDHTFSEMVDEDGDDARTLTPPQSPRYILGSDDDDDDDIGIDDVDRGSGADGGDIHTIIIDCGTFNFVDSSGLSGLVEIFNSYRKIGVKILMVQAKRRVRDTFSRSNFYSKVSLEGQSCLFVTIHDAVLYAIKEDDLNEVLIETKDGKTRTHIHHTIVEDGNQSPEVNGIPVNSIEQETSF